MGFVGSHVKLELFDESRTVAGVWRGASAQFALRLPSALLA